MTNNTDALRIVAKFVGAANSARDVCEFGELCDAFIEEARAVIAASPQAPAAQPQQAMEPLTDEQVYEDDGIMTANAQCGLTMWRLMQLVRAIERAHGITARAATGEKT